MEKRTPTLREKVAQLRRTYLGKLPETLEQARQHGARLGQSPAETEAALDGLFHIFHSIKGTAASFGLKDVSAEAALGEAAVAAVRDGGSEAGAAAAAIAAHVERLGEFRRLALAVEEPAAACTTVVAPPPAAEQQVAGGRSRIYVCDDEEGLGEQLEAQLGCFGYAVRLFSDPESLRLAVLANPPDAVIMDIVFPGGVNGTDVVATLWQDMHAPPPVVFLSVQRGFDWRLKAVKAGGQAYFLKPVKVTDLVETLDTLTARHEPEPFRVLVVDDEPEVAGYHSLILQQAGMVTRLLHEPAQILDVLAGFKPDLMLMDMYMPQCSGRDLSRMIRQVPEFVSLPIVFLSSETDRVKQVSALRVGAEGFLTKPIQPDELISAVAIRAERMRTLRSLMVRDSLTGLFNHTFMTQSLETALANAQRTDGQLCFVMIDLDYFKRVNDTYGHPAGDQVLVALARVLQQRLRNADMVGRYGGEEFAAIMQNTSVDEAAGIVDGIREDFARIVFRSGDRPFSCTFSSGVAGFPAVSCAEELVEAADRALYAAKHGGRNRVRAAVAGGH